MLTKKERPQLSTGSCPVAQVGDTHYYGKVSLAREFTARAGLTAASGGLTPVAYEQDLKENWLEFALGLTGRLGRNTDGYL